MRSEEPNASRCRRVHVNPSRMAVSRVSLFAHRTGSPQSRRTTHRVRGRPRPRRMYPAGMPGRRNRSRSRPRDASRRQPKSARMHTEKARCTLSCPRALRLQARGRVARHGFAAARGQDRQRLLGIAADRQPRPRRRAPFAMSRGHPACRHTGSRRGARRPAFRRRAQRPEREARVLGCTHVTEGSQPVASSCGEERSDRMPARMRSCTFRHVAVVASHVSRPSNTS